MQVVSKHTISGGGGGWRDDVFCSLAKNHCPGDLELPWVKNAINRVLEAVKNAIYTPSHKNVLYLAASSSHGVMVKGPMAQSRSSTPLSKIWF